jgi:RalA-binding protein 1
MYSENQSELNSVPPPSSRALGITTDTVVEEPEEEEEEDSPSRLESPSPVQFTQESFAPTLDESIPSLYETRPSEDDTPRQSIESRPTVPPAYSQPTRLSASLLPHARLSIPNSTVFPNALGRDVLCFIVSVTIRPPNSQLMSWNVAKLFSAFIDLDTKIKAKSGKGRKEWKSMVAPLPEGRAWKDFAPSKIDQRKKALEAYIQSLLVAPLSDKSDLCDFLSTDKVLAKQNVGRKEGYLTKKGKNFGGWKTRYFVLDGPVMEYYEQASRSRESNWS